MKHFFKHLRRKTVKAFTLVEMLLVLAVVSVLLLLFVPNLSKQKESINHAGGKALVKVIESQAELYKLSHDGEPTLSVLEKEGFIDSKQVEEYKAYADKVRNQDSSFVRIAD